MQNTQFLRQLFRNIPTSNINFHRQVSNKMSPHNTAKDQQPQDAGAAATTGTTKPAADKSRNIEIKARLGTDEQFAKRVATARRLCGNDGELIEQHDVFYNVRDGRLKLRYLKNVPSQLVQYARPDVAGPKLSTFDVLPVAEPDVLNRMLAASLGVRGEVRKVRHLFLYGQTRVHLDRVEGLGNFLEFEVCLRPEQTVEEGAAVAEQLRVEFEIGDGDLIEGAYLDDLLKKE